MIENPDGSNSQDDENTHFGYISPTNGQYLNYITGHRNYFRSQAGHFFSGGSVVLRDLGDVIPEECINEQECGGLTIQGGGGTVSIDGNEMYFNVTTGNYAIRSDRSVSLNSSKININGDLEVAQRLILHTPPLLEANPPTQVNQNTSTEYARGCTEGRIVIGGGCSVDGSNLVYYGSWPDPVGNRFICKYRRSNDVNTTRLTVYALCL
jgi:hypothetical protein